MPNAAMEHTEEEEAMGNYLIKPNGNLGYSRVETSSSAKVYSQYEDDGYRSVSELEYELARLLTVHSAKRVMKIVAKLGQEMGEEVELV